MVGLRLLIAPFFASLALKSVHDVPNEGGHLLLPNKGKLGFRRARAAMRALYEDVSMWVVFLVVLVEIEV
jgi:hypothetical protein